MYIYCGTVRTLACYNNNTTTSDNNDAVPIKNDSIAAKILITLNLPSENVEGYVVYKCNHFYKNVLEVEYPNRKQQQQQ